MGTTLVVVSGRLGIPQSLRGFTHNVLFKAKGCSQKGNHTLTQLLDAVSQCRSGNSYRHKACVPCGKASCLCSTRTLLFRRLHCRVSLHVRRRVYDDIAVPSLRICDTAAMAFPTAYTQTYRISPRAYAGTWPRLFKRTRLGLVQSTQRMRRARSTVLCSSEPFLHVAGGFEVLDGCDRRVIWQKGTQTEEFNKSWATFTENALPYAQHSEIIIIISYATSYRPFAETKVTESSGLFALFVAVLRCHHRKTDHHPSIITNPANTSSSPHLDINHTASHTPVSSPLPNTNLTQTPTNHVRRSTRRRRNGKSHRLGPQRRLATPRSPKASRPARRRRRVRRLSRRRCVFFPTHQSDSKIANAFTKRLARGRRAGLIGRRSRNHASVGRELGRRRHERRVLGAASVCLLLANRKKTTLTTRCRNELKKMESQKRG